jgi:acyl-CoA synthetase (AMP-forming)/AMP-acid ligase II/acyl carrier protein
MSAFDPAGCATIVDVLRARARHTPERTAYLFLHDGEVEGPPLRYADLDARARAIAARLQEQGAPGERALLLFPPGLEFVTAFFGCLYAGVVAVPAYPPRANRPDARIQEIAANSQPRFVLTTAAVQSALATRGTPFGEGLSPVWLATDEIADAAAEGWREPAGDVRGLALLQYTSGSTRAPKGVMVSHRNIMANSADFARTMRQDEGSLSVSWLPHFHDLGLIWGILQPLYSGYPAVLMAPAAFLQRPLRWLAAISKYRATVSGAPNFAYDLCTARITAEERAQLDLSRWEISINGAEPVRQTTLKAFAETFAPCGLHPETVRPGYGMAECTLMITLGPKGSRTVVCRADAAALERHQVVPSPNGDARIVVGCGPLVEEPRIVIADPQTGRPVPDGEVGEIWAKGASVAEGYWNQPEETARTFAAVRTDTGEGPFLRTGDLGFVREGELFITGRLKDLIIIRGLNHYPQDIEATVEGSHQALRPGAGAAFSVDVGGDERLVIVQEVDRVHRHGAMDDVFAAIRRAVTEEHEVEPWAIVLIRPATVRKTSSGKIQRLASRADFLAGNLSVVAEWRKPEVREEAMAGPAGAPRTEADIAGWLLARLARESGIEAEEIDLGQPFAAFGLDSARSLLLVGDLEGWLGRRLNPVVLWNYPTVESLARHLGG